MDLLNKNDLIDMNPFISIVLDRSAYGGQKDAFSVVPGTYDESKEDDAGEY